MMRHREATRHLSDLLSGELTGGRRAELDRHVEGCEECRIWSETYGFLGAALSQDQEAGHPSSEQLAHLAVDAQRLTEPERERLDAHLEECPECRRELAISRQAVVGAGRGAAVIRLSATRPSRRVALGLALAASLILAVGLALVALRSDGAGRSPSTAAVTEPQRAPGEVPPIVPGEGDRQLSGARLEGTQVIEAPRVITATAVAIESGGDITFRAGEMVVLGDGFSIRESATLGVEIATVASDDRDSDSHT